MSKDAVLPRPADVLPHKPPFLFVDEITGLEPGRRVTGHWTPSADQFAGLELGTIHVTGALVIEALAQAGAVAILLDGRFKGHLPLFGGIDQARFPHPVAAGERIDLSVELDRLAASGGRGHGVATVGDRVVCDVRMMFMMVDVGVVPAAPGADTQPADLVDHASPTGEHADLTFRLLLSHETGLFEPADSCVPGAMVQPGMVAGYVGPNELTFREAGVFGTHLAIRGQRVKPQQPVAWIDVRPEPLLRGAL